MKRVIAFWMIFLLGMASSPFWTGELAADGWNYAHIDTDKSEYSLGQWVNLTVWGNDSDQNASDNFIDLYVYDSAGIIVEYWLSQMVGAGQSQWNGTFYLETYYRTGTWAVEVYDSYDNSSYLDRHSFDVINGSSGKGWTYAYIETNKNTYSPGEWMSINITGYDGDGDPGNNYIDVYIYHPYGWIERSWTDQYVGANNWSGGFRVPEGNQTNGSWRIRVYESYFGQTLLDTVYFNILGQQRLRDVDFETYYDGEYCHYFNPGDTVEFIGYAYYDWGYSEAPFEGLKLYVFDPHDELVGTLATTTDEDGMFSVSYVLPAKARRGYYYVYVNDPDYEFYDNDTLDYESFRVEEKYLSASVSADTYYNHPGDEIQLTTRVNYSTHSEPAPNVNVLVKVHDVYGKSIHTFTGTTDENGEIKRSYTIPQYVYRGYYDVGVYDTSRDADSPHYEIGGSNGYYGNRSGGSVFAVCGVYTSSNRYSPGNSVRFDDYSNYPGSHGKKVFEWDFGGTNYDLVSVKVSCGDQVVWQEENTTRDSYYDRIVSFTLEGNAPYGRYDIEMRDLRSPENVLFGFFYVVNADVTDRHSVEKDSYVPEDRMLINVKAGRGMEMKAAVHDELDNRISLITGTVGADGTLEMEYILPVSAPDGRFRVELGENSGEWIMELYFNVRKYDLDAHTDVEVYLPGESVTVYYTVTNNRDNGAVENLTINHKFSYHLGDEKKEMKDVIHRPGAAGRFTVEIPKEVNGSRSRLLEMWANDTDGRSRFWAQSIRVGTLTAWLKADEREYARGEFAIVEMQAEVICSGDYYYGYTYPEYEMVIFDGDPIYLRNYPDHYSSEYYGYVDGREVVIRNGPYHHYGGHFTAPLRDGNVRLWLTEAGSDQEIEGYSIDSIRPDYNGRFTYVFPIDDGLELGKYDIRMNATKDGTRYWDDHTGDIWYENRSGPSRNEASCGISVVENRTGDEIKLTLDPDRKDYYSGDTANITCHASVGGGMAQANLVYTVTSSGNLTGNYIDVGSTAGKYIEIDIPGDFSGTLSLEVNAKDSLGNKGTAALDLEIRVAGIALSVSKDRYAAGDDLIVTYSLLGRGMENGEFFYQIKDSRFGDIIERGGLGSDRSGEFNFSVPEVGELDQYYITVLVMDDAGACYQKSITVHEERGLLVSFHLDREAYRPGDTAIVHYRITSLGDEDALDRVMTLSYGIYGLKMDRWQTTRTEGNLTYVISPEATDGDYLFTVSLETEADHGGEDFFASYKIVQIGIDVERIEYMVTFALDKDIYEPGEEVTLLYSVTPVGDVEDALEYILLYYGISGVRMDDVTTSSYDGIITFRLPNTIPEGRHYFIMSVGQYPIYGDHDPRVARVAFDVLSPSGGDVSSGYLGEGPFDYTVLIILIVSLGIGVMALLRTRKPPEVDFHTREYEDDLALQKEALKEERVGRTGELHEDEFPQEKRSGQEEQEEREPEMADGDGIEEEEDGGDGTVEDIPLERSGHAPRRKRERNPVRRPVKRPRRRPPVRR